MRKASQVSRVIRLNLLDRLLFAGSNMALIFPQLLILNCEYTKLLALKLIHAQLTLSCAYT